MTDGGGERDVYSYEPFTRHAFYLDVNRRLVRRVARLLRATGSGEQLSVVDLGAGTGALTRILAETFHECGVDARITAVEPSAAALVIAERQLAGSATDIRFVHGDAADLPGLAPVDVVFFCNAIHLVADKDDVVGRRRPGAGPRRTARAQQRLLHRGVRARHGGVLPAVDRPGAAAAASATPRSPARPRSAGAGDGLDPAGDVRGAAAPARLRGSALRAGRGADDPAVRSRTSVTTGCSSRVRCRARRSPPGRRPWEYGAAEAFGELSLQSVPRRWLQLIARAGTAPSVG